MSKQKRISALRMLLNILPHFLLQNFFSYFPSLTPGCFLWSGVSHSLKNVVVCVCHKMKKVENHWSIPSSPFCCEPNTVPTVFCKKSTGGEEGSTNLHTHFCLSLLTCHSHTPFYCFIENLYSFLHANTIKSKYTIFSSSFTQNASCLMYTILHIG